MSPRARIERLLLLNWKGLFFQPFELHEAVTALEGENGAGKTTVMIGAFVALLPDPQRLAFRNIGEGEGGDGDRGIYGRLGAKGPSYSLLDIRTADGDRVVAGVCLLRGAAPRIEFKRFVVEGLAVDADLEALVLVRDGQTERIPELTELREAFARVGATLRTHDSVGRYCGRLHELGVLPMRMEQPQDRQRFHQMLHTSMYGGFSGSLQKGLRDYLLNEDQRLRNHVARMRENLETCRITRRRISEADGRYRLIAQVFGFGWGMVEAAFHGTRLLAETRRVGANEARAEQRRRRLALREAGLERDRLVRRHAELRQTLGRLEAADREAADLLERCQRARRLTAALEDLGPRRDTEQQALTEAQGACAQAEAAVLTARDRHRREQRERDDLALDLGRAQDAFAAISVRVGQYRAAQTCLADARAALPDHPLEPERLADLRAECDRQWEAALRTQSTSQQELDGAEDRRRRFDALLGVLGRLLGGPVAGHEAADSARLVDAEHRDLEDRLARAADLPQRIREAEGRARRQAGVRQRLAPLAAVCGPLDRADRVREAHATQVERRRQHQARQADLREACSEHRGALDLAGARAAALDQDLAAWHRARALADELSQASGQAIEDPRALEALRVEWVRRDDGLGLAIEGHAQRRRGLVEEAEQLEFGGGRLDESLVALADRLDGRLLAEFFDALPAAEAARAEARLGPLHAAVLVPDIAGAAATAARQERCPEHLWLVSAGDLGSGLPGLPAGETLDHAELVRMGDAWRLSRHPERPVVGRVAREQEIARLRAQAADLEATRDGLRAERDRVRGQLAQVGRLAAEARWLGVSSPEAELRVQRRVLTERAQQLRADEAALAALKPDLAALDETCAALEACLADAGLLDEEDGSAVLHRLRRERDQAQADRARLEQTGADIAALRDGYLELQQPPPDTAYLDGLRRRRAEAGQVLDYWSRARHLLRDLIERVPHLAYADQEALLAEQEGALGGLRARLATLGERVAALEQAKDQAEQALETARGARNDADGRLKATLTRMDDLRRELAETGEDGSAEALSEAQRLRLETGRDLSRCREQEGQAGIAAAVATSQVDQAAREQAGARETWRRALVELRPHWRNWVGMRRAALGQGVLERLVRKGDPYQALGPPNVLALASERRGQLGEALKQADGGAELAAQIERGKGAPQAEGSSGLRDLRAWVLVRGFLEQSIPRDLAQSDDPEVALAQIGQHLEQLRDRLLEQEQSLRHSTEDIANSIQVKIRREEARIGTLNRGLARVRFGSIRGVRIHMERHGLMLKLLDAMRTQPDLFEQDAPLEDVMANVYRGIGGGQVQGDQLLDYRQYVRIGVQVQRLGQDAWYEARAGALSTGESIGVGAAVLVVVLDAWEQQAALLKGRKAGQALRFLFLDEANRLSPESLDTLTEFCELMQVQLLAAAPAADRARRGHIYRLVRRTDAAGEEEVVVRGRRMRDALP